jgi:hypothetical protein
MIRAGLLGNCLPGLDILSAILRVLIWARRNSLSGLGIRSLTIGRSFGWRILVVVL